MCFPGDILSRDVLLASAHFPRAHYCIQMYPRGVFSPLRQVSGDQGQERRPVAQARLIQTIFGLSYAATGRCAHTLEFLFCLQLWPATCF